MENWKKIGINLYEASEDGQIRNGDTGIILKGIITKSGYRRVTLYNNGVPRIYFVHRLVWETFVGKIPEGYELDHIDGNPQNNRLENLRCVTHLENMRNPVTRVRHVNAMTIMHSKPEHKNKISGIFKKLAKDPEFQKKHLDAIRYKNGKRIQQLDKHTGEVIKEFICQADAERELGISQSNISACCLGKRKTSGGYRWQYAS